MSFSYFAADRVQQFKKKWSTGLKLGGQKKSVEFEPGLDGPSTQNISGPAEKFNGLCPLNDRII